MGGEGEVTHASPNRRRSLTPRSAATALRGTCAARARSGEDEGTWQRGSSPPAPGWLMAASRRRRCPDTHDLRPALVSQQRESGGQPSAPRAARHSHWRHRRRGGEKRLNGRS